MRTLKNAVGYIRVSTAGQAADDKYGEEAQRQAILLYADANDYSIVKWYVETGSGAKERPIFDEIVWGDDVTNPPFEAVIVFKNDRVARETKLYFTYLFFLEKKGVTLLSTQEQFDEGGDFANIYRSLLQFVAEQERKNIAKRTGAGRKLKASCGGYSGGRAPYGYKVVDHQLVIREDEAEIVRLVFASLDAGKTLQEVADDLNAKGYHSRVGKTFAPSQIRSIRDNRPTYEGMYKYGEDMTYVKGLHEPIIEKSVDNKIDLDSILGKR